MRDSLRSKDKDFSDACGMICMYYSAELLDIEDPEVKNDQAALIDLLADVIANKEINKAWRAKVFRECLVRLGVDSELKHERTIELLEELEGK